MEKLCRLSVKGGGTPLAEKIRQVVFDRFPYVITNILYSHTLRQSLNPERALVASNNGAPRPGMVRECFLKLKEEKRSSFCKM